MHYDIREITNTDIFLNNVCISLISEMVNKKLLNRFLTELEKSKKTIFFNNRNILLTEKSQRPNFLNER